MIESSAKEFNIIQRLVRKHFSKGTQIWAYGSRVDGTCHDTSDLKIVIHPTENLPDADAIAELLHFKKALQQSNIVILVDARLWSEIPEYFYKRIQQRYEVLNFEE